jgi:hypothetical protein
MNGAKTVSAPTRAEAVVMARSGQARRPWSAGTSISVEAMEYFNHAVELEKVCEDGSGLLERLRGELIISTGTWWVRCAGQR